MTPLATTNGPAAVFVNGAREQLAATLNGATTAADAEAARQAAEAAGIATADADTAWAEATALAAAVVRDAARLAADAERQHEQLKPEVFTEWVAREGDGFATRALTDDKKMRAVLDGVRARYAAPAYPMPATNAELQQLRIRLERLDHATPEGAEPLVADAVQRGDLPFLHAAASDCAAWIRTRNSWRAREAEPSVRRITDMLERAVWTPARAVEEHVAKRAEATYDSWRFLISTLANAPRGWPVARLDAAHYATGALRPLLERPPK